VLAAMLRSMHLIVDELQAPFEPEGGAYASAHAHRHDAHARDAHGDDAHDHAHDHGHEHSHDHAQGHGHSHDHR
jgi:urease accessory protein